MHTQEAENKISRDKIKRFSTRNLIFIYRCFLHIRFYEGMQSFRGENCVNVRVSRGPVSILIYIYMTGIFYISTLFALIRATIVLMSGD